MPKSDPDVKKYAFDLDFFATNLMIIIDGSSVERVQRMIHALACERKRLKAIDPNILFSVPGSTGRETNCES
jgi:hypothetical protein